MSAAVRAADVVRGAGFRGPADGERAARDISLLEPSAFEYAGKSGAAQVKREGEAAVAAQHTGAVI